MLARFFDRLPEATQDSVTPPDTADATGRDNNVVPSDDNQQYQPERSSALAEIDERDRASFEDVFPSNRREAMEVAVLEAETREALARQVLDAKADVPVVEHSQRSHSSLYSSLSSHPTDFGVGEVESDDTRVQPALLRPPMRGLLRSASLIQLGQFQLATGVGRSSSGACASSHGRRISLPTAWPLPAARFSGRALSPCPGRRISLPTSRLPDARLLGPTISPLPQRHLRPAAPCPSPIAPSLPSRHNFLPAASPLPGSRLAPSPPADTRSTSVHRQASPVATRPVPAGTWLSPNFSSGTHSVPHPSEEKHTFAPQWIFGGHGTSERQKMLDAQLKKERQVNAALSAENDALRCQNRDYEARLHESNEIAELSLKKDFDIRELQSRIELVWRMLDEAMVEKREIQEKVDDMMSARGESRRDKESSVSYTYREDGEKFLQWKYSINDNDD